MRQLLADTPGRSGDTAPVNRCANCAVRDLAICAAISAEMRVYYSRDGRTEHLAKGQTLIWEGENDHLAGIVVAGALKLSISLRDGREQIVGVVYPADFVGEPFTGRSQYSVTALTDSEVCIFAADSFAQLLDDEPDISRRLLEHSFEELNRSRRWMLLLGRKSASERIASFLLEIAQRLPAGMAPEASCRLELPLDRQQIADLLGLTIETVSRHFSAMRGAGIIRLPSRRTLEIIDHDRLQEMSGD